ncbi:acetolactate decarboxylase [Eubacterium xylanophilum]|uniref:acetolactate decarboxylase n=1 Tax=Eubacterium xylanophilum TaxID=39497 RepID=UPI0004B705E2|nr:acetolactate decarboxylase [Eubacterium xylanophilum]
MKKTKRVYGIMAATLLASAVLTACGTTGNNSTNSSSNNNATNSVQADESKATTTPVQDRECLYQVSLLQDLTQGDYYGSIPVSALKERGDIGLGTFDKLNGELIMLDGKVYRADGAGKVEEVPDDETIPFASVTFFDEDDKAEFTDVKDLNDLIKKLDEKYTKDAGNYFQVVKIKGLYEKMNVRSELAQEEPYKPLAKVMETDQKFFDYENVSGTVVGVYCPVYVDKVNSSGWHFHFVSDDGTKGGHIVDLALGKGEVQWDKTTGLDMDLPEADRFGKYDFSTDQSGDVKKVEKPKG